VVTKHIKFIHKKRFWAGLLLAQFLLFFMFSTLMPVISFFEYCFELQKGTHQLLFSLVPFSVGDLLYILVFFFLIYHIIKCFKKENRRKSAVRIFMAVNIFYFGYQVFWGMLYFQTPVLKKLASQEKPTVGRAKVLALRYLERCKATRDSLKEDKGGVFMITDRKAIQYEILSQQSKLPYFISGKKVPAVNSFKPSLFGNIMSYTGILGYYNPFTAEAQYNSALPSTYLPFTLAHESSHQLGFAREQEANFVGYLLGIHSKNTELRYSTEYFTLKSLLGFILDEDPAFVKSVLDQYSPAMKRDRNYEKTFVVKHQGILDDFFAFTNNLFLKGNQQEGSVTYSYFMDLLQNYEK